MRDERQTGASTIGIQCIQSKRESKIIHPFTYIHISFCSFHSQETIWIHRSSRILCVNFFEALLLCTSLGRIKERACVFFLYISIKFSGNLYRLCVYRNQTPMSEWAKLNRPKNEKENENKNKWTGWVPFGVPVHTVGCRKFSKKLKFILIYRFRLHHNISSFC